MPWRVVSSGDPWAEAAPPDRRPVGIRLAVAVVVLAVPFFAAVGAVVVAPHSLARLVTDCPTRASAVAAAARSLHAAHVTGTRFSQGDDGAWVATFDAVAGGTLVHARTTAEYHHHWYADCYAAAGTTVIP